MAFRNRFSRLFDLALFKEVSVFAMCQIGWGQRGEAWRWRWRRGLFVWEEELVEELCLLLQNMTLQVDKEDRWLWRLESSNVFTVRSAYKVFWHKDIPLKGRSLCLASDS